MTLTNAADAAYLDDTRTLHIAEVSGHTPEEVVEFAETLADQDGATVDEELTVGDDFASLVEEVSGMAGDGPDLDEDGDISGWDEDDDC